MIAHVEFTTQTQNSPFALLVPLPPIFFLPWLQIFDLTKVLIVSALFLSSCTPSLQCKSQGQALWPFFCASLISLSFCSSKALALKIPNLRSLESDIAVAVYSHNTLQILLIQFTVTKMSLFYTHLGVKSYFFPFLVFTLFHSGFKYRTSLNVIKSLANEVH